MPALIAHRWRVYGHANWLRYMRDDSPFSDLELINDIINDFTTSIFLSSIVVSKTRFCVRLQ